MPPNVEPTPMKSFESLRELSPTLYHICGLAIGVAAALSIFKVFYNEAKPTEFIVLICIGILLYSISVLFEFFTKHPRRRRYFSAVVVLIACLFYGAASLKTTYQVVAGPSSPTQPTWCALIPGTCDTGRNFEEPVEPVLAVNLDNVSPISDNQVYFQFAGSLSRQDDVIPFLSRLLDDGWNGQGFERGGERTPAAAGLNIVRYYYPEDEPNARRLVNAIFEADPPRGSGQEIGIQRLDPNSFDKSPAVGTLEIWMSN